MTALERYALNFARVVYGEDSLDDLDNTDWHYIHQIFNHFYPQYHDQIAEYPLWIIQKKNMTPRDWRRVMEYQRRGDHPMFLFSRARIETYLDRLEQAQSGEG